MKCMNLIYLLLLTSSAIAMEKDPNDGDIKTLTLNYEGLDFSDETFFKNLARERLQLIESAIESSFFMPLPKILADLESLKKNGEITAEYAKNIFECASNLTNPKLSIKYPKNPDSGDYENAKPDEGRIEKNTLKFIVPSNFKSTFVTLILKFENDISSGFNHKVINRYMHHNFLFPLPVAIEAAELTEKGLGKVTINQALTFIKEYVIGSIASIKMHQLDQPHIKSDKYETLIADMYWSINILRTKLSQEINTKEIINALKEIFKFPSKVIRDLILDPYATPLNENNAIEEIKKMEKYNPYTHAKKTTPLKYESNKDLINAIVNFFYNKGMLDVSLKTDLNIENLPKHCNTVKYYYENLLKDNEDNSTVYGINLSSLGDEENRLKDFEDLEIEEKQLQKEEPPKYEEKITQKEYNQEKIVAKYSKYNPESIHKKPESKSFGLLIGEKQKDK
jgi:hypothetical protein